MKNNVEASIATVCAVIIAITMIYSVVLSYQQKNDLKQMLTAVPNVELSQSERWEFAEALVCYAANNPRVLDAWVKKLGAEEKRFGVIPALPREYKNISVVRCHGKWILCADTRRSLLTGK